MASSTSAPAKTGAASSASSFHNADATLASSAATGAAKTRLSGTSSGSATSQQQANCQQPSILSFSSSVAFQQVKQTQASLARLSRVHNHHHNHNQQQQQHLSQTNQSSQQVSGKSDLLPNSNSNSSSVSQSAATTTTAAAAAGAKSTTFIDCLIRRFKDCFSEDFCTVPMFVVGNLSPGSDGTHLILPPCVSLGRQSISRFAGPKNLRLLNSIRESCRSIEELDLGGNKLTDLIEVYKILQCTPNLKFLNLSENDLSRTSPVAMANCPTTTSSLASSSSISTSQSAAGQQQQWPNGQQRAYLAPINQNYQPTTQIGSRRHSTLGASTASSSSSFSPLSVAGGQRARPAASRVAEARRLAAAAAVAQSKKTSSSVASKLTETATGGAAGRAALARSTASCGQRAGATSSRGADEQPNDKLVGAHQRHQSGATSTMHLARSLSSLSSKDVVRAAAGSSLSTCSRLAGHHSASGRAAKEVVGGCMRSHCSGKQVVERTQVVNSSAGAKQQQSSPTRATNLLSSGSSDTNKSLSKLVDATASKLFVEPPIVEAEDVDMSAGEQQQLSPAIPVSSNNNNTGNQLIGPATANSSQSKTVNSLQIRASTNVFSPSSPNSTSVQSPNFRRTFESIKALALNNTGCQWRVVCSILSRMPNLEELHLSLNNYERIDLDPNEFKHYSLKRLYLCNNPKLTNWEELDKLLSAFPSLQALSIADCNISQIPENLDRAREWRKLCGLNINGWPIKEWPVIERLNQLPSLIDLKCRNLEILSTIDEPRHHLIARLPKLKRLNGSEIEEREHAEKTFLRFFMANSHLERPPRFHELVQIHGEVIPVDVDVDLSPPSQANVRVVFLNKSYYRKENNEDDIFMSEDFLTKLMDNVDGTPPPQQQQNNNPTTVVHPQDCMELSTCCEEGVINSTSNQPASNNSSRNISELQTTTTTGDRGGGFIRLFKDESQEVVSIDIDLRQSVRKFKSIVANIFDLESQNLILYYIDHEMVGLMGPELIKHNKKKLWNYNVQDGDQFIVEER